MAYFHLFASFQIKSPGNGAKVTTGRTRSAGSRITQRIVPRTRGGHYRHRQPRTPSAGGNYTGTPLNSKPKLYLHRQSYAGCLFSCVKRKGKRADGRRGGKPSQVPPPQKADWHTEHKPYWHTQLFRKCYFSE